MEFIRNAYCSTHGVDSIIIPVLLISKQRFGEFKNIACIHTVSECQSQTLDTEVWLQSSTL